MTHVRSSSYSMVPGSDRHIANLEGRGGRNMPSRLNDFRAPTEESIRGMNALLELAKMPEINIDCVLVSSGFRELYTALLQNDINQVDLVADQIFGILSSNQDHANAFSTWASYLSTSFKQKNEHKMEVINASREELNEFIEEEASEDAQPEPSKYDFVQKLVYNIDPNPDVFIEELKSLAKSDADLQLIKRLPEIVFERAASFSNKNRIKIAAAACSEAEWNRYFGKLDYFKMGWPTNIYYATVDLPAVTNFMKGVKNDYLRETFPEYFRQDHGRYEDPETRIRMSDEVMRDKQSVFYKNRGFVPCSDDEGVIDVDYTERR